MSNVKPTTKEQLVYYMLSNINLGTYDNRFLTNIQSMNISPKKPLTSNQADLLNKIIQRYSRQFAKKEIKSSDMISLPWTLKPISSLPEYTQAYLNIEDGNLILRSPYKATFVKEFREHPHTSWIKEKRYWSAPFNEEVLKQVIDLVVAHYDTVNFCDDIKQIINLLSRYDESMCWNPTLKIVNGNLYIAATNHILDEVTKDIPLELSAQTFAKLSLHGINIEPSLYENLTDDQIELMKFALERSPVRCYDEIAQVILDLDVIGCDYVLIAETHTSGSRCIPLLIELCKFHKIEYDIKHKNEKVSSFFEGKKYKYPVIIATGLWANINGRVPYVAKVVNLANNKPINIK